MTSFSAESIADVAVPENLIYESLHSQLMNLRSLERLACVDRKRLACLFVSILVEVGELYPHLLGGQHRAEEEVLHKWPHRRDFVVVVKL